MNHKNTTKLEFFISTKLFDIFYIIISLPDDDIEYIEKLRRNKKFKFCRIFTIHNFEANCSQNNLYWNLKLKLTNRQLKQ